MVGQLGELFHCEFAGDAACALSLMEQSRFDAIVSDMRMPGMDGAALLAKVQVLYPDMLRVVLSGYADVPGALRAVPVAHRFLSKPCDANTLRNVLMRSVALHRLLGDVKGRGFVANLGDLPARPETHAKLTALLARQSATAREIAKLISLDVAISAKLLQFVNSASFGAPRRITSIDGAVNMLGTGMLQCIVLATAVSNELGKNAKRARYDLEHNSQHALLTASLARRCFSQPNLRDDAFAAGLLHNIGELLLVANGRDDALAAIKHARVHEQPVHLAEQALKSVPHAHVGAIVLGSWGISYDLVEAVAYHHESAPAEPQPFDVVAAVQLGAAIAEHCLSRRDSSLEEAKLLLAKLEGGPSLESLLDWAKSPGL